MKKQFQKQDGEDKEEIILDEKKWFIIGIK